MRISHAAVAAVPLASHIRFSPTHFNGTNLDTGGMLANYWDSMNSVPDGIHGKCLRTCFVPVRCGWEFHGENSLSNFLYFKTCDIHLEQTHAQELVLRGI